MEPLNINHRIVLERSPQIHIDSAWEPLDLVDSSRVYPDKRSPALGRIAVIQPPDYPPLIDFLRGLWAVNAVGSLAWGPNREVEMSIVGISEITDFNHDDARTYNVWIRVPPWVTSL